MAVLAFAAVCAATPPAPPQPIAQNAVAQCASSVGPHQKTSKTDPQTRVYGAQQGFVILSYQVVNLGNYGHTTEQWTSQPPGSYVTSNQMASAYNAAFSLVSNSNLSGYGSTALNAALTNSYNLTSSYAYSISSSFGSISLITNAWGNGQFNFNGGSACTLSLNVVLLPVEPCMLNAQAFNTWLMGWTENSIRAARLHQTGLVWDQQVASLAAPISRALTNISQLAAGDADRDLAAQHAKVSATLGWPLTDSAGLKALPSLKSSTYVAGMQLPPQPHPTPLTETQVRVEIREILNGDEK